MAAAYGIRLEKGGFHLDAADLAGIAGAVGAHVAIGLFVLAGLSIAKPPEPMRPPMQVTLIAETAKQASAPVVRDIQPAPRLIESEELNAAVREPPPAPQPAPKPVPQPAPQPVVRKPLTEPQPRPAPAKILRPQPAKAPAKVAVKAPANAPARPLAKAAPAAPAKAAPKTPAKAAGTPGSGQRPSSRLDGIVKGLGTQPSQAKAPAALPKAQTAEQVRQTVQASIYAEVRPIFARRAPNGTDIEKLVTLVEVRVNPDGTLAGPPRFLSQSGKTESNRPQQQLHVEEAIKSVRLAAPFNMSAADFSGVQTITLRFKVN